MKQTLRSEYDTSRQVLVPLGCDDAGAPIRLDVSDRADGPHLLFTHAQAETGRARLLHALADACAMAAPEDLSVFLLCPCDDPAHEAIRKLPHCVGAVSRQGEIPLGFCMLKAEVERRIRLLHKSGMNHLAEVQRAYREGRAETPCPPLLVYADMEMLKAEERKQFVHLLREARCLEMHGMAAVSDPGYDTLGEAITCCFRDRIRWTQITEIRRTEPSPLQSLPAAVAPLTQGVIWQWTIPAENGATKTLRLINGDLCDVQESCDVVVCSAFKQDYMETPRSLIGRLANQRGISVGVLSMDPELDLRAHGCWLSKETGMAYRRVACVELLSWRTARNEESINLVIQRSFSTLYFVLEQASISGIPIRSIAAPILGTGDQHIELAYILAPMIAQCRRILTQLSGVDCITLYEKERDKAAQIAKAIDEAFVPAEHAPDVFLSYSSKQRAQAIELNEALRSNCITCWMAPASIPAGSDYLDEIPKGINQTKALLLLLTPEAEQSRWVQKEVSAAIGADKVVIPYQITPFTLGQRFAFLLDGEQILPAYTFAPGEIAPLIDCMKKRGIL